MTVEKKIKELIAQDKGQGYANACQIWKGCGEMGQAPYGWWMKPFNGIAKWIGKDWNEVCYWEYWR